MRQSKNRLSFFVNLCEIEQSNTPSNSCKEGGKK